MCGRTCPKRSRCPYPLEKFKRPSRRSWAAWRSGKRVARAGLLLMVRRARPAPSGRLSCRCRAHCCARACRILHAGRRWLHILEVSDGRSSPTSRSPARSWKPQLNGKKSSWPAEGCLRARLLALQAAAVEARRMLARRLGCCCSRQRNTCLPACTSISAVGSVSSVRV